jgi:hypothetical protein
MIPVTTTWYSLGLGIRANAGAGRDLVGAPLGCGVSDQLSCPISRGLGVNSRPVLLSWLISLMQARTEEGGH